jgi:sulfide:quinone oxidoreductase
VNGVPNRDPSRSRAQILIAGGGFAAVEAALALRALAGNRVALAVLAPDPVFHYRPAATSEPFDWAPSRRYDLRAVARDLGAEYHESRLEAVASRKHFVRTASGARLQYDALIMATGARAVVGVPGALTFRDQRDIRLVRRLLGELEAGAVRRIVFAMPTGSVWPLPLYELALLTARYAREHGLAIDSTVVTPETEPLAMFGTQASGVVRGLLEERGVRFVGGAVATAVQRDGSLALADGEMIEADRVLALPELRGRRFTGVPTSRPGFIPVDASGRVEGLEDVYAAGDVTTFPIKQGGLAAHQADVVAQMIAASLGAPVKQVRAPQVLHARVLGGEPPLFLRTEFDWSGQPTRATLVRADDEHTAKAAKVVGRYLLPYLETREPLAGDRQAAVGDRLPLPSDASSKQRRNLRLAPVAAEPPGSAAGHRSRAP